MKRILLAIMALPLAVFLLATQAPAQASPFAPGWVLDDTASSLRFQSIKKQTVVESSEFATFSGLIRPDGTAEVTVQLDSVDTKIDLRNVRMRFLFFETFKFPEAKVRLQIPEAVVADLPQVRRMTRRLPYELSLHGVTKVLEADLTITLLSDDLVSVASDVPISLGTADFNLEDGRQKLQEAANVTIVPSATVSFDFLFRRLPGEGGTTTTAAAPAPAPVQTGSSAALETQGNFSVEECAGRFEILSRAGNIFFASGSARLTPESQAILDSIAAIVTRCPGMVVQVSGHTDSDGSAAANQRLSEARAQSVVTYLVGQGVATGQLRSRGFGETQPLVPNDSAENKARNRRIAFDLAG